MTRLDYPSKDNSYHSEHTELILSSYRIWTGKKLLKSYECPLDGAEKLFHATFALLSHDTQDDPVFNYGNLTAMKLFELNWDELVNLNSRKSAEPLSRPERERFLKRVAKNGFIDDYEGVRISSSGRRFVIRDATVWNLVDAKGKYIGQAATFSKWEFL